MALPRRRRHFGPIGDIPRPAFPDVLQLFSSSGNRAHDLELQKPGHLPTPGPGRPVDPGVVLLVHVSAVDRGVGRFTAVPLPLVEFGVAPGPPRGAFPAEPVRWLAEEGRLA